MSPRFQSWAVIRGQTTLLPTRRPSIIKQVDYQVVYNSVGFQSLSLDIEEALHLVVAQLFAYVQ